MQYLGLNGLTNLYIGWAGVNYVYKAAMQTTLRNFVIMRVAEIVANNIVATELYFGSEIRNKIVGSAIKGASALAMLGCLTSIIEKNEIIKQLGIDIFVGLGTFVSTAALTNKGLDLLNRNWQHIWNDANGL